MDKTSLHVGEGMQCSLTRMKVHQSLSQDSPWRKYSQGQSSCERGYTHMHHGKLSIMLQNEWFPIGNIVAFSTVNKVQLVGSSSDMH